MNVYLIVCLTICLNAVDHMWFVFGALLCNLFGMFHICCHTSQLQAVLQRCLMTFGKLHLAQPHIMPGKHRIPNLLCPALAGI